MSLAYVCCNATNHRRYQYHSASAYYSLQFPLLLSLCGVSLPTFQPGTFFLVSSHRPLLRVIRPESCQHVDIESELHLTKSPFPSATPFDARTWVMIDHVDEDMRVPWFSACCLGPSRRRHGGLEQKCFLTEAPQPSPNEYQCSNLFVS